MMMMLWCGNEILAVEVYRQRAMSGHGCQQWHLDTVRSRADAHIQITVVETCDQPYVLPLQAALAEIEGATAEQYERALVGVETFDTTPGNHKAK